MSVVSWLSDLIRAAITDAVLRRPIDVKVRRSNDGKVDVDVRMSPSGTPPPQPQPRPYYWNGYYPPPHIYPPPAPPPQSSGESMGPSTPDEGHFQMPRSFEA